MNLIKLTVGERTSYYVAFNVPPGTALTAPFSGRLSIIEAGPDEPAGLRLYDPKGYSLVFSFMGSLYNFNQEGRNRVRAGARIATISDRRPEPVGGLPSLESYNLLVVAGVLVEGRSAFDPDSKIDNLAALKQCFPAAFLRPMREVVLPAPPPGKSRFSGDIFLDGPADPIRPTLACGE